METTYKDYDSIPQDVFADKIQDLAFKNAQHTLSLPGIYEIISEEYNDEALDELCPETSND